MNLPDQLIQSLKPVKGFDENAFTAVHTSGSQVTSIRLNPAKIALHKILNNEDRVPWSSQGYYLLERPSFTLDPLFHAGAYYVQEASSMFLEEVLKQTVAVGQPVKVLDLCAAPGGKSTLIQSLITENSLLVSNEVIKPRANILMENMAKWGAPNVVVTNNDPQDFQRLPGYFDVLVIDAPCSGSGLFRKDPNAINEWSEKNVVLCGQRQQRILADILPALKPGGVLIYSTCSYSATEDEMICDWLVNDRQLESLKLQLGDDWGIVETVSDTAQAFGYRFYPDKVRGEGFFIAAFKKAKIPEPLPESGKRKSFKEKKKPGLFTAKEIDLLQQQLQQGEAFYFIKQHEEALAIPMHLKDELEYLQATLYVKKAGIKLGTVIREELIPAHELAVCSLASPSIPKLEVDKETALQYLRRQEINITSDKKGWILLTHQHIPMGWVKVMQNRVNNYYPANWRILNK